MCDEARDEWRGIHEICEDDVFVDGVGLVWAF